MSMTLQQARVVDPVLSEFVQGYKQADRVGSWLFPTVPVAVSAGKVIEFNRESFMLYNARRAPGGATKRIEFGYEGKPYALVQDALESKVPREYARDALTVPGIDLGMRATATVMNSLNLALGVEQASIATDVASYDSDHKVTLSGTSVWSDEASDPIQDIENARQVIRQSCGMYPNVAIGSPLAYKALKNNPKIISRFQNVDIITSALLANLFEIDRVVEGKAVVADNTGRFSDVWGNGFVLAYAPTEPNGMEEPSYGYTYTMKSNPFVEQPYWDGNTKSWIYGVTYERAPVLAGMEAGFLFANAG